MSNNLNQKTISRDHSCFDQKNSGSVESQVSILTKRIDSLTEHFKLHKQDHHSRFGLVKIVNLRNKLLKYLKRKDSSRYTLLIKKLKLRG